MNSPQPQGVPVRSTSPGSRATASSRRAARLFFTLRSSKPTRVRRVEGLRVADISILPEQVSGNTAAPAMAIGRLAADVIARTEA